MFYRLLALFILVPLVEMLILIGLGDWLGFWPTIGLVIVTGFFGASLARAQGVRALGRIQGELAAGRVPTDEMVDGLLVLVGGIVLLTPGLLTDLAGLALMVPAVRAWVRKQVQRRLKPKRIAPEDLVIDG